MNTIYQRDPVYACGECHRLAAVLVELGGSMAGKLTTEPAVRVCAKCLSLAVHQAANQLENAAQYWRQVADECD